MIQKIKNFVHKGQAVVAQNIYSNPSKKMIVIGITGTDGKTTTSTLLYSILKKAGKKTALITTLGASIGDTFYETGFHTTTPSPFSLQKYIKKAKSEGCEYLILEVTSHALDQNRTFGIHFDVGIVTNISHEHLDYHKTFENYMHAKAKLLKMSNVCILNADDASYNSLKNVLPNKKILSYSINLPDTNLNLSNFPIKTNLIGEFNKKNCLAASLGAISLGIKEDEIKNAIEEFTAPSGRQEVVFDKKFKVIIDFAHTPNAFESILSELSKTKKGRIIHVFGAAGMRDKSKRPLMGEISSQYSDIIILTAEDPRKESIESINSEIEKGFSDKFLLASNIKDNLGKTHIYYKISDRKTAFEYAISIAKEKDIIVVTGKGHEKSMNYGKGEILWDEKEAIIQSLKKYRYL